MGADGLVMMEDLSLVIAILAGVEGGGGFGLWRGETQQDKRAPFHDGFNRLEPAQSDRRMHKAYSTSTMSTRETAGRRFPSLLQPIMKKDGHPARQPP